MTKALLIGLISGRKTLQGIADCTGKCKTTVRYWLRKHGLRTTQWGALGRFTREDLSTVVAVSLSYSDCLRRLGLPTTGGTFNIFKRRLVQESVNTSHFKRFGMVPGSPNVPLTIEEFRVFLVQESKMTQSRLRRYFRRFSLRPYVCRLCYQMPVWRDQPLALELDHINGVNNDCRLENLRWLCPNCHSQTETFGRRNGAVSVTA